MCKTYRKYLRVISPKLITVGIYHLAGWYQQKNSRLQASTLP